MQQLESPSCRAHIARHIQVNLTDGELGCQFIKLNNEHKMKHHIAIKN
jgi:hypothetical protein